MIEKESCSNCRNQMTGWDGGFFGLPVTCECRIYGVTEGRKGCSKFEKKVTKSDLIRKVSELEMKNEQLRKTINEVIELLLEEVDLFSDKATEHDIIAYKEMNQFDNKDAYYMCISTKKAIQLLQRCLDE